AGGAAGVPVACVAGEDRADGHAVPDRHGHLAREPEARGRPAAGAGRTVVGGGRAILVVPHSYRVDPAQCLKTFSSSFYSPSALSPKPISLRTASTRRV